MDELCALIRGAINAEWHRRIVEGITDSPDGHVEALADAVMARIASRRKSTPSESFEATCIKIWSTPLNSTEYAYDFKTIRTRDKFTVYSKVEDKYKVGEVYTVRVDPY